MRRESCKYVWDANEAAKRIAGFIAGKALEDYLSDDMLRSAVERQLLIVGEALSQLARRFPEDAARIPDLKSAVGMRNVIVHRYRDVDDPLVWRTINDDLPKLQETLQQLLDHSPPPGA